MHPGSLRFRGPHPVSYLLLSALHNPAVQPGPGFLVSEREEIQVMGNKFLTLNLWPNAVDSNTTLSVKVFVFCVDFFFLFRFRFSIDAKTE